MARIITAVTFLATLVSAMAAVFVVPQFQCWIGLSACPTPPESSASTLTVNQKILLNIVHATLSEPLESTPELTSFVNPATVAFLIKDHLPKWVMFFILVDQINEVQVDTKGNVAGQASYFNNPNSPQQFGPFVGKMASLAAEGLTAQIDVTASFTAKQLPPSRLCIDASTSPRSEFGSFIRPLILRQVLEPPTARVNILQCENIPWLPARYPASVGDAATTPRAGAKAEPLVAYPLVDRAGNRYQVSLRSIYGVYVFIGDFLHHPIDNLVAEDSSGSGGLINIIAGKRDDCFVELNYRQVDYCIPNSADNSKKLFAIIARATTLATDLR